MSKILETLKKLVRLSANNSNQHEAEAAMLKAQKIAIQNNIDLATVSLDDNKKAEYIKENKHAGQRFSICHKFITAILGKYFNVGLVTTGNRELGRYLHFIGTPDKVEFAKFAYDYLNDTFINCWRNYYDKGNRGIPLSHRETYLFGLYKGFDAKLEANKAKMEAEIAAEYQGKYALIVLSEEEQLEIAKERFFTSLTPAKDKTVSVKNTDTYNAGFEQGQRINVSQQIAQ